MGSPSINRNLPWDEIRHTWEISEIGLTALAARYNIGSVTTLKRRRAEEGWKRNADVIAAKQSLADVIADAAALRGFAEPAEPADAPPGPGTWRPPSAAVTAARADHYQAARPVAVRPAQVDRDAAGGAAKATAEELINNTPLERLRDTSFARQMAAAAVIQNVSLLLLRRLAGVLQPPEYDIAADGAGQEQDMEALGNLQRLIRINPDRETLAGLVAAGSKAYELGIAMERRAVADTVVKPAGESNATPSAQIQRDGLDMLKLLDVSTAEKMRGWAMQIQRERREAEIAAASDK